MQWRKNWLIISFKLKRQRRSRKRSLKTTLLLPERENLTRSSPNRKQILCQMRTAILGNKSPNRFKKENRPSDPHHHLQTELKKALKSKQPKEQFRVTRTTLLHPRNQSKKSIRLRLKMSNPKLNLSLKRKVSLTLILINPSRRQARKQRTQIQTLTTMPTIRLSRLLQKEASRQRGRIAAAVRILSRNPLLNRLRRKAQVAPQTIQRQRSQLLKRDL